MKNAAVAKPISFISVDDYAAGGQPDDYQQSPLSIAQLPLVWKARHESNSSGLVARQVRLAISRRDPPSRAGGSVLGPEYDAAIASERAAWDALCKLESTDPAYRPAASEWRGAADRLIAISRTGPVPRAT